MKVPPPPPSPVAKGKEQMGRQRVANFRIHV